MKFYFNDVFWLKTRNLQGDEKFKPIRFSEDFKSVWFLDDEVKIDLSSQISSITLKSIIASCKTLGFSPFFAPENTNITGTTTMYFSKTLYLKALKHGTFKNLPEEVKSFVCENNKKIDKIKFDDFCKTERLSRRVLLSYKKAFKKATKYVEQDKQQALTFTM